MLSQRKLEQFINYHALKENERKKKGKREKESQKERTKERKKRKKGKKNKERKGRRKKRERKKSKYQKIRTRGTKKDDEHCAHHPPFIKDEETKKSGGRN